MLDARSQECGDLRICDISIRSARSGGFNAERRLAPLFTFLLPNLRKLTRDLHSGHLMFHGVSHRRGAAGAGQRPRNHLCHNDLELMQTADECGRGVVDWSAVSVIARSDEAILSRSSASSLGLLIYLHRSISGRDGSNSRGDRDDRREHRLDTATLRATRQWTACTLEVLRPWSVSERKPGVRS